MNCEVYGNALSGRGIGHVGKSSSEGDPCDDDWRRAALGTPQIGAGNGVRDRGIDAVDRSAHRKRCGRRPGKDAVCFTNFLRHLIHDHAHIRLRVSSRDFKRVFVNVRSEHHGCRRKDEQHERTNDRQLQDGESIFKLRAFMNTGS